MGITPEDAHPGEGRQFRLAGLMFGVAVLGCATATVAGLKDVGFGLSSSLSRPAGAAMAAIGSALAIAIASQAAGRIGRGGDGRLRAWWPVAWRVVASLGLATVVVAEMTVLRDDSRPRRPTNWNQAPPWWVQEVQLALLPIVAAMGMVGLVLASRPGPSVRRRSLSASAMAPLAALAGLLMAAIACDTTYLVLIAVDSVEIALRRAPKTWSRWSDRLLTAGGWSLAAAGVVTLGAIVVARDLRGGRPTITIRSMAPRLVLLAAVAASGVLTYRAIERVNGHIAEGIKMVTGRAEVVAIVLGFAGLAAGLASRSATRPAFIESAPARRRRLARASAVAAALVLGAGLIAITPVRRGLLSWLGDRAMSLYSVYSGMFEDVHPLGAAITLLMRLDLLSWLAVTAWLTLQVSTTLFRPGGVRAPLDAIADEPGARAWFAWCTSMLTVVCLAALPVLFLSGLTVLHLVTNAEDLFGVRNQAP